MAIIIKEWPSKFQPLLLFWFNLHIGYATFFEGESILSSNTKKKVELSVHCEMVINQLIKVACW
jgi:hypothetical protein